MTVSEELPCPFCGEQPHFTPRQGKFAAYVACINESCGIQPESGSMDPAYAKARWNTRAMKAAEPLPQGDEATWDRIERVLWGVRDGSITPESAKQHIITAIGSQSIEGERG